MFDWLTTYSKVGKDTIKQVESKVAHLSEVRLTQFGLTYHNGYVSNLSTGRKLGVSWNPEREMLTIKVCPNKFLLGNNVEETSVQDVVHMFEDLSEMFSYNFAEALVKRCDITHTAQVDYEPEVYYPYMCHQDTFYREEKASSLYYRKQGLVKLAYDKAREVDQRKTWGGRQKIPEALVDKNLFRFEVRYNSPNQVDTAIFGRGSRKSNTLSEVLSPFAVEQFQKEWLRQYNEIPKMTEIPFDFTKLSGAKATKDEIVGVALSQMGRLNIEKLIIQATYSGALKTHKQVHDARKILDVFKQRASKSNHILELDHKIQACEPKMD